MTTKRPALVEFVVVDALTGEHLRGTIAESLCKVFFGVGSNCITRHAKCPVSVPAMRNTSGKWQLSRSKKARHVYVMYREVPS